MAEIEIPKHEVTPMDEIAVGVEGLRIGFVNVFGIRHLDGTWTLVDAGLPFSATLIRTWAERHFSTPPVAIVLTHGHFDHVSAAGELAGHWDVPVYAHPLEAPYLTGQREYPAPDAGAGGGLMSLLSPIYPRGPIDLDGRLHLFAAHDDYFESPVLPDWKIVTTPGHTPGHVSFFRTADRVLLVGDAFCTTKPESFFSAAIAQPPVLHGPPAYFTWDWQESMRSVHKLAKLDPLVLAPGHGRPLAGPEVEQQVAAFALKLAQEIQPTPS